jgi:hypothetical protein
MPIFTGTFWYSDLCYVGGKILCAYERGHNDRDYEYGTFAGETIGQIGLTTFNLAALLDPPLEQVVLGFDDFPAGTVATTQDALIRDYGPYDARAAYIGSPKYVNVDGYGLALEIGNGGTGDAVRLAGGYNSTYDPDRFNGDSGSFSLELDISTTEATSTRTIIGKYHGMGLGGAPSGWKGYTVELVNTGGPDDGKVAFTISDGTNLVTVDTPEPVNDGRMHKVILVRDNVNKLLRAYNADTSLNVFDQVADTTSAAIGTLSSSVHNYGYRLGQFDDTGSGGWSSSHPLTIGLLRFVKEVIGPTGVAPLSLGTKYVPASAAESFPPPNANTPDTVAGTDLALWLLDQRGGFGSRTGQTLDGLARAGSSPVPLYPAVGQAVSGFMSGDGTHLASGGTGWTANYNVDPIIGGYWSQASDYPSGTLLNTATGSADPFAFVYNLTSAWSFAMKFRVPTGSTSRGEIFDSLDSNFNGLEILVNWNGNDNAANIFITCANNVGGCWFYTQAYARDSWYYLAVTYDGSGGAGTAGLTSYLVPLTGTPVTPATVMAAGAPPTLYSGNSNNVGSAFTTERLSLGGLRGGATGFGAYMDLSDLIIVRRSLSIGDIALLANNLANRIPDPAAFGTTAGQIVGSARLAGDAVVSPVQEASTLPKPPNATFTIFRPVDSALSSSWESPCSAPQSGKLTSLNPAAGFSFLANDSTRPVWFDVDLQAGDDGRSEAGLADELLELLAVDRWRSRIVANGQ